MSMHIFHGPKALNLLHKSVWTKTVALYNLNKTNTPLVYMTASRSHLNNDKSLQKTQISYSIPTLHLNPKNQFASILFGPNTLNANMKRKYSTKEEGEKANKEANKDESKEPPKKQSKFKQLYSQYGPIFLVVHMTTVVLWIYSFFLISKQ